MNAPLSHPAIPAVERPQEIASNYPEFPESSTAAIWRQIIAEMNLRPGVVIEAVQPDRLSFDAWRR